MNSSDQYDQSDQADQNPSSRPNTPEIAAILDQMWARFLPDIRQRAEVLETSAAALAAGRMTDAQRQAAHSAAHKLAGTLGTFNLMHGTELAREFELITANEMKPDAELGRRLLSVAADLRTIIDSRR